MIVTSSFERNPEPLLELPVPKTTSSGSNASTAEGGSSQGGCDGGGADVRCRLLLLLSQSVQSSSWAGGCNPTVVALHGTMAVNLAAVPPAKQVCHTVACERFKYGCAAIVVHDIAALRPA